MVQKPKALKYKVIAGYLLLFATAVVSVWFVYTEILKIALPGQTGQDNNKIIKISNTIASLYSSEAVGRSYMLTGSAKDLKRYTQLTDSINIQINEIKEDVDSAQVQKFDSIQLLLTRKKNSIKEIIKYRKSYSADNTFTKAIYGIYEVKDSIWTSIKPVKITKRNEWRNVVTSLLSPQQLDSLSKLPVSNDSLAMAFEKVLTNLLIKDNKLRYTLYRKEQKLLEENRIISDQLRVILTDVENEFLQKSYNKIRQSQSALGNTVKTMAWVGAASLFFFILFAYVIIRDLTSNQNYRKQLESLNLENEELLRSKSMLMATVTHDLQTPLGSIIGFHNLIKDSGVTPKQNQYLANIKESANYILKLVNDLLDFSRLENNRITVEKTAFNMKTVIESACRVLEPIAVEKNIELNWDVEDELNAHFISDPYRIKQVLTNLISNAIKFTHEGSVEVTAKIEGFDIFISVLDTGIGIAQEKHGAVFKEFTQAHDGIEKKFGGTGLGLTISKKIVELLDGTITLESKEGQGSIFTISIPCIAAKNFSEPVLEAETKPLPLNAKTILAGKKILVVDDDNVQLILMKELLQHHPVSVTAEINSSAVQRQLEENKFDIILTDVQMPVMDGFDLVKMIRSHSNNYIAKLPVVALSGKRDLTEKDYISRGFTAHHPKPIQLEQLLTLISGLFSGLVSNGIQHTETLKNTGKLYSLNSLSQFTNNDPVSLKTIVLTFIESAQDNCTRLRKAAAENDTEELSQTAHRMIPMLKQMEVYSIAEMLMPVEDGTLADKDIVSYIEDICGRMDILCENLQSEIA
ncbi:response regulator [Flavobacterium zepuense]|uniref:histidine kinase n=1 Tax=Flavobacterium zepuense TaxID=2593302 RepID=A0A552V4H8_9FLAO|nr:ATP-binding protein [Flavobacterium zepuense]TRW25384.1 response regulator [Flavobacterium zepuense]